MTYYIYKGYDNGPVLARAESIGEATSVAKRVSKQLGLITVRDCLGGLRVEIKPSAPITHRIVTTK